MTDRARRKSRAPHHQKLDDGDGARHRQSSSPPSLFPAVTSSFFLSFLLPMFLSSLVLSLISSFCLFL
ncbi:uncharacterized protein DS421_10g292060 [Arachis hypogaea]|nr:uncharacterized protein DS421_10g292060 [Arachis hypogaea]